ncbi:MAG: hypothetical protein ACRD8A_15635 [Candidatus Acidiferrales bacterium]
MSVNARIAAPESLRAGSSGKPDQAEAGRPQAGSQKGAAGTVVKPAAIRHASDDEILGISAATIEDPRAGLGEFDWDDEPRLEIPKKAEAAEAEADQLKGQSGKTGLDAILEANPELRQAWDDAQAYRESFQTPEEARIATAALADLAKMDALFFSGRSQDHAELAKVVASLDPAAFRSLAKAMAEVADQGQGSSTRATVGQNAGSDPDAGRTVDEAKQVQVSPAQEQFFHSTNAAAVQAVIQSIESQVERLLPEEISKGARNRLVGEIYRELDTSLRADRQFADQARAAFQSGSLDDAHRRAVVSLVNSRARQALPAVARRVLNEWTSAIVSANQDRRARQRAAERRVDIGGSGRTGNEGVRPVTPRDINYSRMSDADILNM